MTPAISMPGATFHLHLFLHYVKPCSCANAAPP